MKVTQEPLPASQIGLEIEITSEMSKKAYERVLQDFTRKANIPGFRKGKVPRQVLIQRFGMVQLKAAALESLIDDSLKEAIKQEKIDALGNFQLVSPFEQLVEQYEPGSPLTFSASVDVQPTVVLKTYQGLQVQAEEIKPDPDRADKVLQDYRQQVATLVPVEGRAAQFGDVAVVDYKGMLVSEEAGGEPQPVPGGEAENFQVELSEGRFIEGFIDGIVGMNSGETKEISVKFPEDYPQEPLAGKAATFTITVKEIKEKELPELDDEFAEEISEFKTIDELRQSLEERNQKEAEERTKANKEQAILDELIQHVEVEVPETLIERELNFMLNQTAMQLQNQGIDPRRLFTQETIAAVKERSRPEAVDRIKRTLALGEVAKQESIEVGDAEVQAKTKELLAELEDRSIDPDRLESVIREDLLREKIVNWLIEHSTIELVPEGTLSKPEEEEEEASEAIIEAAVEEVAEEASESSES